MNKSNIVSLEPILKADKDYLFELQNIDNIRLYAINPIPPSYEEHCRWFNEKINGETTRLFKIILNLDLAGVIRLDIQNSTVAEVSLTIDPKYSGRGLAKSSIQMITENFSYSEYHAVIHDDNIGSKKAFFANNFTYVKRLQGSFCLYKLNRD